MGIRELPADLQQRRPPRRSQLQRPLDLSPYSFSVLVPEYVCISSNAEFLTIEDTAAKLRVDLDTARRLLRLKELPGVKIGAQWSVSAATLNACSEGGEMPAQKARE